MPINVICPGCHKRFTVNEKFAGKRGPCPKCKEVITIPSAKEEVKIHAPDEFGPKGSSGQGVLKPIFREETKLSSVAIAGIVGSVAMVFVVALVLRFTSTPKDFPIPLLIVGAVVLAPALAWGGYSFLRDQDLQPHRGANLVIRIAVCSALYAGLWGLYGLGVWLLEIDASEFFSMVFIVPILIAVGGFFGLAAFDLDYLTGVMHYGLYLAVTVGLRLLMNLQPFFDFVVERAK